MTVRKTKTVKLNDQDWLIRELTTREIIAFIDQPDEKPTEGDGGGADLAEVKQSFMAAGLGDQIDQVLELGVPGLHAKDLIEWAPSEIERLYDEFREVNATFFAVAQRLGLNDLIKQVEKTIAKNFSDLFVKL